MDDLLSDDKFTVFIDLYKNICNEYEELIDSSYNGDVNNYLDTNKYNPYVISVPMQPVLDCVEDYFLDIISSVRTVFNNVVELEDTIDRFIDYYGHIKSLNEKEILTDEDKSMVIALDLILINKNRPSKKISNILRSMCKFPQLGTLVHLTESVL